MKYIFNNKVFNIIYISVDNMILCYIKLYTYNNVISVIEYLYIIKGGRRN